MEEFIIPYHEYGLHFVDDEFKEVLKPGKMQIIVGEKGLADRVVNLL